jgi:uncharacterized membrane protein YbhN (UPF0104 family)
MGYGLATQDYARNCAARQRLGQTCRRAAQAGGGRAVPGANAAYGPRYPGRRMASWRQDRGRIVTKPPETHVEAPAKRGDRLLFGGSALPTLACIGALAASAGASGGGPGILVIGAVYLAAAALAAAAPSPGGLGAIEAALVAGLGGVGMLAGPAVSAVLLYRLATYWLPVLPGWLSWRVLQRREYV